MTPLAGDVDRLGEIARIALSLDLPRVHDEALAVAARLADGQFYVACVGQFKRGKSTLIDALLDDPVLPTGIVPITAVPTVVRYGDVRAARVRLDRLAGADATHSAAGEWQAISPEDLPRYVSEECNPENHLGVVAVEVFAPSALLAGGMCLVDTPGLGSVFETNSSATRAFIPQIDAAILVIGADPPLSGDELDLIAAVARQVTNLVLVLNKSDRVTDEERRVASDFARRVIERRLNRDVGRIYQVSATDQLAHSGAARDWDAFVTALQQVGNDSSRLLVLEAGRRAVARLTRCLLLATREERAALLRPAEESDRHIRSLETVSRDGERAVLDLGVLLAAEQQRLSSRFAAERAAFLRDALPRARDMLAVEFTRIHGRFGPSMRRAMMRAAQDIARHVLDPWLADEQQSAGAAYRDSMTRFIELADGFLDRLAGVGLLELEFLRGALDSDVELRRRSTFVFNEVLHVAEPASPLRFAADIVLGLVARGALARSAQTLLDWLLEMNSSRVESDVDQRAAESRRSLEARVRALLKEVEAGAKRTLARASDARAAGSAAIEQELRRLQDAEEQIAVILRPGNCRR